MAENIRDKVVVITGASSGLGEAAARLLAREG
ncbi:oxidoreductase, partial [Mesorhizobium sp. M7A.F.Ca.MR.148.00.0.0]